MHFSGELCQIYHAFASFALFDPPQISTVILMIPVTSVLMSFLNYTASLAVCFSAVSGISRPVPLEMTQGPDRHSASRFFR